LVPAVSVVNKLAAQPSNTWSAVTCQGPS